MANLYVTRVSPSATLPTRATPFSAGLDIACCFHEPTVTIFDDGVSEERKTAKNKLNEALDYFKSTYNVEELNNPLMTVDSILEAFEDNAFRDEEEFETFKQLLDNLDLLSKPSIEREVVNDTLTLYPGERAMIPTGLRMSCDANHYLAFYPRSGNALKRGLTLINCTGIGDRDYSDEYYITLVNDSKQPQTITNGDKVAQMIVRYYADVDICERLELPQVQSNRAGGFGSTGQ